MPIVQPGKRVGARLARSRIFGKGAHGRKGTFADLLITPLVDMFVIVVIFLLQNFSATGEILFISKDIKLPEANNGRELERAPVVQISSDAVMLEGEQIAAVADLGRDEYWNIPALEEKLRDLKKRYEMIHQGDPASTFKGDINIQGDKQVLFKTLKRVMYSCNQAGYLNMNYAVMQGAGARQGEATAKP
jgi:biopolymer transport protein ExbD